MAKMVPSIPRKTDNPAEIKAFNALKEGLSDDYLVYHSYRWTSKLEEQFEGASDFLIYHPQKGLLVIDIYSDHIQFNKGFWEKIDHTGNNVIIDPDPLTAANTSRKGIYKSIRKHLSTWPHDDLLVGAAVWFSDIFVDRKEVLPENYHHMLLMDQSSYNHIEDSINAAYKYYHHAWKHDLCNTAQKSLKRKLNLEFNIISDLRAEINYRAERFFQMTKQQMLLMDFLEHQEEACIGGVAGSGKTLLAIEKATRLAESGRKVLLLCYNRLLSENLHERIHHANIHIDTFHNFAASVVGIQTGFKALEEAFLKHMETNKDLGYHDLIIDEGQDFNYEWLSNLKQCFYQDSFIYTFYDLNQNLYDRNEFTQWILEAPCKLSLTKNCRNTIEINDFATRIIAPFCDTRKFSSSDIHGDAEPKVIITKSSNLESELATAINDCINKYKYQPEDIIILSAKGSTHSEIKDCKHIGIYPLSDQHQVGKVQKSTIRKFKGLESKVVILVEVEPNRLRNAKDRAYHNLIYAGVTRATDHLIMIEIED